jgi:hypothetical protein
MGDARFAREIGILRSCRDANILQFVVRMGFAYPKVLLSCSSCAQLKAE